MLYLLFVLTFLCGILFYGMSPHDKQLDMTAHQAEGMIVTFLAQHQAAKDYLYTWLGMGPAGNANSNVQTNNFLKTDFAKMELGFKKKSGSEYGITSDMCTDNTDTPGDSGKTSCFVSKVVCTNAAGTNTATCGDTSTKHYVITYGGWANAAFDRPDWWPSKGTRMRRFESWRKAIANRTRGSISCGVLFYNGTGTSDSANNWCIDNGETQYKNEKGSTCMNPVPSAVINALPASYKSNNYKGAHDLLFCMSEFKQGVKPGHYAVSPAYFYDGLSNIGVGQHQNTDDKNWVDLVEPLNATRKITTATKVCMEKPCFTLTNAENADLKTPFSLSSSYTITLLVDLKETSQKFDLFANLITLSGTDYPVFRHEKTCGDGESVDISGDCFRVMNGEAKKVWFTSYNSYEKLTSWTIVVDGTKMRIYENAVLRYEQNKPALKSETGNNMFKMKAYDNNGARIYGIRYYSSALTQTEIQKNFKVDQKRFGIPDKNNGNITSTIHIDYKEEE